MIQNGDNSCLLCLIFRTSKFNVFLVGREFLSSIHGLGLKSVECIRLLALHQNAFPVSVQLILVSRLISCSSKLLVLQRMLQNANGLYCLFSKSHSGYSGCFACHELHKISHSVNLSIKCGAGGYKRGTYLCEARLGSVRTTSGGTTATCAGIVSHSLIKICF